MFSYFKGCLAFACHTHVIIEVQGIGYTIFIPARLLQELPALQEQVQFYTTFVVREYGHTLYGFLTIAERDVFEVLMNVIGVGPKLALSLIGHLKFSELQKAIIEQDFKTLCLVPGVGKKTAERLVVELKDKLSSLLITEHTETPSNQKNSFLQDAIGVLVNLGYHSQVALKAVQSSMKELIEPIELSMLITMSLQKINENSSVKKGTF